VGDPESRRAVSFHELVGIDVDSQAGCATVSLDAQEQHLNPHGTVHGGVLATLADIAMGAALNAATGPDDAPVTVSLVMTYLEPAPPGLTTATGTITRQGKRITIAEAAMTSADGTVVATAVGTFTLV
jgi:uncharacterized protein (TIGR00369 family)